MDIDDLCRKIIVPSADESEIIHLINDFVLLMTCDATALCQASKRPFATKLSGATVLHLACELGLTKVFDHILALCSDPILLNKRMSDGATALFLANVHRPGKSEEKSLYMTTVLVDRGADMSLTRSRFSSSPFHVACEQGYLESAKFLLRAMLDKGFGIDDIAFRTNPLYDNSVPISVLQISVLSGLHSRVCRWLTSEDCKVLWTGGCVRDFVRHSSSDGHTALTLALSAKTISMDNIICLVDSGALLEPRADHIFKSLLPVASKNSTRRSRPDLEEQLFEYLFEQALQTRVDDFESKYPPDWTLLRIVCSGWNPLSFAHTEMLVRVVRKLIAMYPHVFTKGYVQKCKMTISKQYRFNPSAILLDLYPYDPGLLFKMLKNFTTVPILTYYMRQYIAHTKQFNLNVRTLRLALLYYDPEIWRMALSFLLTTIPDPTQCLVELAQIIDDDFNQGYGSKLAVSEVRLLYHVHNKFPGVLKGSLVRILHSCSSDIASSLCWHMLRDTPIASLLTFRKLCLDERLLFTIMWHSDVRPSQLLAKMVMNIEGPNFNTKSERQTMIRHLLWVYNLRHMIREKRGTQTFRIVLSPLGPGHFRTPLPFKASESIVACVVRGEILDLSRLYP